MQHLTVLVYLFVCVCVCVCVCVYEWLSDPPSYAPPCPLCSWVEEFVSPPNHGHLALLNVLKDVLNCPDMPQHKNPKKAEVLDRAPVS